MKHKKRMVFITNIPNNYRIPLFNELNKQLQTIDWELHVIFGAKGYNKRKAIVDLSDCKFNHTILESGLFKRIEKNTGFLFYSGLTKLLAKLNPEEILVTGFALSTLKIWFSTFYRKRSYHIVSGSILPNTSTSLLRKIQRKILLQKATGFVAYGTLAKDYLMALGAPPSKVICMGNTVDTTFYHTETSRLRKLNSQKVSTRDKKHLTYIGYINPRKNVEQLIGVIEKLLSYRKDFVLDVIGDGESLAELHALLESKNLQEYVVLHGFKQREELPQYMAISSVFLFQTSFDIWGLVLNEAMAAGIPCMASINAGATVDLIDEGVTGFKANFQDHENSARKINWILNNPVEMERLGKKASDFIRNEYSLEKSAKNILSIINK